ncbi:MAG: TatD family hydrolase [Bacteroidales bacterium]|jgi:TatD DNase family protein|nr:TatD family hydrolase [Bacteroidales bacterium]
MEFIDTHAHLYVKDFDGDRDEVIKESLNHGVRRILLPNIDLESLQLLLNVCQDYPEICYPMTGLHPCDVKEDYKEVLQKIFDSFSQYKFIAVGETGIDQYWDKTYINEQKDSFRIQIQFAINHNLPVIIHKRQSYFETMEVLNEFKGENIRGIFHCYSGSVEHANEIIEKGFLLGIGGTVTYKTSNLDKVLPHIPLEYIVLETDAPYLTPVPYRGMRNKSAYIPLIAQRLADIKQTTVEEVAKQTTKNAIELFSL